jgi:hypothetical protein
MVKIFYDYKVLRRCAARFFGRFAPSRKDSFKKCVAFGVLRDLGMTSDGK